MGEIVGQVANLLGGRLAFVKLLRNAQLAGNAFRGEGFQCRRSLAVGQGHHVHAIGLHPLAENDVGQAKGQVTLHTGADGQPLVGIGRSHRKTGVNVDQVTPLALATAALAELAIGGGQAGGRAPGGQEIGAKGNDVVGVGQVKVGQAVLVEDALNGSPVGRVVQGFKPQVATAYGSGEPLGNHAQAATQGLGNQHHALTAGAQLAAQNVEGLGFPLDVAVLAGTSGAGAQHGTGNAVGVVQCLQAHLGADALLALVDRILGVALNLLGAALHYPDNHALAVGCLTAQGGVPGIPPLDQVFGQRHRALEAQFLVLDDVTGHRSDGGDAGPGQEIAPCQFHTLMPLISLSVCRLPIASCYVTCVDYL